MLLINDMLLPAYPIQALWQRKLHNKKIVLTNDTIFVVFEMYLVSHALCYTKIIRYTGGSRGRVQGVRTSPDDLRFFNTTGILQKKNYVVYSC